MSLPALNENEPVFDRLLQVAVEVFAEHGFRDATVREICAQANVNIASVNYYFRSKEALYEQALGFAFNAARQRYPSEHSLDSTLSSEQRLSGFIENFLSKLLDEGDLGFFNKLIAREIYEPTKALDNIMATAIVPEFERLETIIRPFLGTDSDKQALQRCMLSIFGQCLTYKHSRAVIDRLYPELIANTAAIKETANHIARFSLAALHAFNMSPGEE